MGMLFYLVISCSRVVSDISAVTVQDLHFQYSLFDVGENKTGGVHFTHFQGSSHVSPDRVHVSGHVLGHVKDCYVKTIFFSDHCLVLVSLGERKCRANFQNLDLWKLNVRLF